MADKLDLIPVSEWGFFTLPRPMVIAGPCSAENERQVMETAAGLAAFGIHMFRAGIWKPRTHPGCFEGIGRPGLKWLQKVKQELGMFVCTEVASQEHVYDCIKHAIDMVWIGARTTANPFLVQEIANALRDTDIPVLVKNPVSPDLDLWIGALERLNRAGVRKLGVVHRGFSTMQTIPYRNDPGWRIAIELRTRFPEMPFFADPSHMGGDRKYILELSQRAMDLGLEGLMVESHCDPACALSDARQQLTPEELRVMLGEQIVVRDADSQAADYRENIDQLRTRIDVIDENLLSLLKSRMDVSRLIGQYKKDHNIAILQMRRWDALLENMIRKGGEDGLEERFLRALFNDIHEESVRVQNDILWADGNEKPTE
jgi:chorismate mutase